MSKGLSHIVLFSLWLNLFFAKPYFNLHLHVILISVLTYFNPLLHVIHPLLIRMRFILLHTLNRLCNLLLSLFRLAPDIMINFLMQLFDQTNMKLNIFNLNIINLELFQLLYRCALHIFQLFPYLLFYRSLSNFYRPIKFLLAMHHFILFWSAKMQLRHQVGSRWNLIFRLRTDDRIIISTTKIWYMVGNSVQT